jgi:hypothetical protein
MKIDLFEAAKRIVEQHNANLAADPLLARRLDKDEAASMAEAKKLLDAVDVLPEIDLRGRNLDLRYEWQGHRIGWACWDENTYDGAPDSESNHIGYGPEKEDALCDLLEKMDLLDKVDTHTALEQFDKPRAGRVVHSSPFEPPTIVDDDVTFDDDLDDAR